MRNILTLYIMLLALFWGSASHAQIIFQEDFGSGVPLGPELPAGTTTYEHNDTTTGIYPDYLLDGQYAIGTNTQQAFTSWASITDHTTGSGFMLIVNATAGTADEFYRRQITLTPNTNFELVAYLTPTNSQADKDYCDNNEGGLILPSVKLRVETPGGMILDAVDTGSIPFNPNPQWGEYKLSFTTPSGGGDIVLVLSNNAPGGCGNDIALDDITVRVPVTMSASDDSAIVADATSGASNVINVLDNDTNDGMALSNPELYIESALPAQLTFDTTTGQIGVVAGAASGTYSFEYKVCETTFQYNCDTATVTIIVNNPAPPGGGVCPAGMTAIAESGNGIAAMFFDGNPAPKSVGSIAAAGTADWSDSFSEITWYSYIEIDLTGDANILVAGNTALTLSLSEAWNSFSRAEILVSANGSSWTSLGTIGTGGTLAGAWTSEILRHDMVTIPGTGIRYVRINQQTGGVRVDGAEFVEKCVIEAILAPDINVNKSSTAYSPGTFSVPHNDILYTIAVNNIGTGPTDTNSLFMVDTLPAELEFYNDDLDDGGSMAQDAVHWIDAGSGLNFLFNRDVKFSSSASAPTDFASCAYVPSAGYDANVRHICINPKGAMQAGSNIEWQIIFRARIK